MLVDSNSSILAVTSAEGDMVGVLTEWDVTRATAQGGEWDRPLDGIMSRQVISTSPSENILDMIRKLEHHEISAMPVVDQGCVVGMVSADLLARRSLLGLLQSQYE